LVSVSPTVVIFLLQIPVVYQIYRSPTCALVRGLVSVSPTVVIFLLQIPVVYQIYLSPTCALVRGLVSVSPIVVIFLLQIHVLPDISTTYLCLGERFGECLPHRGNLLVTDTCGLPDIWIT